MSAHNAQWEEFAAEIGVDSATAAINVWEGLALKTLLSVRDQRVLILRFGLYDGRQRTLEEVGAEFNVTRERIRQVVKRALGKFTMARRAKLYNRTGEVKASASDTQSEISPEPPILKWRWPRPDEE